MVMLNKEVNTTLKQLPFPTCARAGGGRVWWGGGWQGVPGRGVIKFAHNNDWVGVGGKGGRGRG